MRRATSPPVVVLHAYSRANRGDALLVELTLDRLERQGVDPSQITVVALDASSFEGEGFRVVQFGTAARRPDAAVVRSLGRLGSTWLDRGLHRQLGSPAAVFGVGGGYLVGGGLVPSTGMAVNHLAQLRYAATSGAATCYLPTGVENLTGPVGRAVLAQFAGIDVVMARDDDSAQDLSAVTRAVRIPDLAVLEAMDHPLDRRSNGHRIVILARELGNDPGYIDRLEQLRRLLPDAVWAVQVEGAGSKSDRNFYRSLGIKDPVGVDDVLRSGSVGAVISVRLHGALGALGQGVPAIHLGYGRKSVGAYTDLELLPWLHGARTFTPSAVAEQGKALADDPGAYWEAIDGAAPVIRDASATLDEIVGETLQAGGVIG